MELKKLAFTYNALPARVIFGAGSLDHLEDEAERLKANHVMVVSAPDRPEHAAAVVDRLGKRVASVFDHAVMHVPIETAVAAREEAARIGADCCVSIGGGSTTGLAKAIALDSGLPILAIPTTYAGSEMTSIWGLTEQGLKKTGRNPRVLPKSVIYDPLLTMNLPAYLSATSGMNAIAHCVEALYSQDANPIISMLAEEGIRALASSLPIVVSGAQDQEARAQALYGAWLGGMSLGAVGMALHHKLCHTLGGTFNLPHAETHTVVLPHVAAYNQGAAPEAMARVAKALGSRDAATGLYDLAATLGAPLSLKEIGLKCEDLNLAAEIASRDPYYNPRPITREGIKALLVDAFEGNRPE